MPKSLTAILNENNIIYINSHFVYISGRHGSTYINKSALYKDTHIISSICKKVAEKYKDIDIDIVVGPAIGGIILSQWTAYHLSKMKGKNVLSLFTEKDDNNEQVFKRNYAELVKNKKVLIVEDITTTGSSIKKVLSTIKKSKGIAVSVNVIVNREPNKVTAKSLGIPLKSLLGVDMASYNPKQCPLCKSKIKIDKRFGHG